MKIHLVAFLLVGLLAMPVAAQQADFFWSSQSSGVINESLVMEVAQGESGTLFLWFTPNGPSDMNADVGAILDIATSQSDIIRFTGAESFEFPVAVSGVEIGTRWEAACGQTVGQVGAVEDDFINEWGAFTPFGFGMGDFTAGGSSFLDKGYDAESDAFLFGQIQFEVVGESGCVQLQTGDGTLGVVADDGASAEIYDPVFGGALISIGKANLGDANEDGNVDLLDVSTFVETLNNKGYSVNADVNCDGVVDLLDVGQFVELISGGKLFVLDPSLENDEPVAGQLGDINGDGFINLLDLACFEDFINNCGVFRNSDINQDGNIDLNDLCPLIELLLSIE